MSIAAVIGATGEKAEAASAKAKARAYVDTVDYKLSTFDYGLQAGSWGGYWFEYSDMNSAAASDTTLRGNSYFTAGDSITGAPFPNNDTSGAYDPRSYTLDRTGDTTLHSFHMGFALGNRKLSCGTACSYDPYIGWGMNFSYRTPPDDTVDLTGSTGISFWAKADTDTAVVSFSVATLDSTPGAADYSQVFKIGPTWAKYTCKLVASAEFAEPSYAAVKPFNPARATGMGWNFSKGLNAKHPTNGIEIDDLAIDHWTDYPPEDGIRSVSRASAAHAGWRLQIQGSQIRLVRPDGDRLLPLNLNGRALPAR
ncbi:MAG: hypothetical protein JF616_17700 [Fibrobacteres bacterium]|nr:hypothetical protein [Fibrobacterota bacterium]